MTDDRRLFPIGRMSFPDRIQTVRPRERSTWTGRVEMAPHERADLIALIGGNPIPYIVGHDPQKLLPSPQHFGREPMSFSDMFCLNLGHALGLTYDEISRPYLSDEPEPEVTRWKKAVIVVGDKPGDIARQIGILSAMPNVLGIDIDIQPSSGVLPGDLFNVGRWNEPDASPLEDITRWRNAVFHEKPINSLRAMPRIRDILSGVKPVARKTQKGYLKHDPTKNHSRRRRK